jgi:hypothetical protein
MGIIQKATGGIANLITAGIEKITGKKYGRQTSTNNIYNTGVGKVLAVGQNVTAIALGTALLAPGATAGGLSKAVASQTIKSLSLKTATKLAVGLTATNVGVGILSKSTKVQKAVKSAITTTNASQFGEDIGTAIENPTGSNLTDIAKNNPLLSVLAGGAIAYVGGKALVGVAGAVTSYQAKQATQANTQAMLDESQGNFTGNQGVEQGVGDGYIPNQGYGTSNIQGQPLPLGQNSSTQPRRRTKTKKTTNISQRLNLIVNNASNNRTIKQKIYKEVVLAY